MTCKLEALYVKACIIANGVMDSQGDTLYHDDIKKIFTSFNNQDNFEIHHQGIPLEGVTLLENYISTADEAWGINKIPSGSWNAVIRVDNPNIKEGLLTGEFKGVSLSNKIAPRCQGNLTGAVRYQDVADAECVIPIYISFVEAGANGYGLHVMDYPAYIQKSKDVKIKNRGKNRMDFKEFMEGLKSLIKQAETTEDEDVEVEANAEEKEEPAKKEEEEDAKVEKASTDEEKEEEDEDAEIKKEASEDEEKEEVKVTAETKEADADAETNPEELSLEERVRILEEKIAELTKDEETEETDVEPTVPEEKDKVDEDTPKITKSEKVIISSDTSSNTQNYYEMTGRDPITGVKLRERSKIL